MGDNDIGMADHTSQGLRVRCVWEVFYVFVVLAISLLLKRTKDGKKISVQHLRHHPPP